MSSRLPRCQHAHIQTHWRPGRVSDSSKPTGHAGPRPSQWSVLVWRHIGNTASAGRVLISWNVSGAWNMLLDSDEHGLALISKHAVQLKLGGHHINRRLRSPDDNKTTIYRNGKCVFVCVRILLPWLAGCTAMWSPEKPKKHKHTHTHTCFRGSRHPWPVLNGSPCTQSLISPLYHSLSHFRAVSPRDKNIILQLWG